MDNHRFDELTRAFARTTSRRQVLKIAAGGVTGGFLALTGRGQTEAFLCRAGGVLCGLDAQCCSGSCLDYHCTCANGQLLCRDRCIPPCTALDACHVAGVCDEASGQCTDPLATPGTTCGAAASCTAGVATGQASCDGSGTCVTGPTTTCFPYVCGSTSCLTSCTGPGDCVSGYYCSGGVCTTVAPNGSSCTSGGQCQSGFCVDGVCCTSSCTGQCEACDVPGSLGTCTAVSGAPHGSRSACASDGTSCGGSCNGTNTQACVYPGSSTSCRAASCSTGTETLAASCNGAGACPAAQTKSCAPYICGATACLTSCTTDGDCRSGNYCSGGSCVAQQANGTSCTSNDQCTSGHCVDGYCCDNTCSGQCEACDATGSLGTCTAVSGSPHGNRSACTTDGSTCGGTCNGSDTTSCTYPGASTNCRAASCSNGTETLAATCNGAGTCPAVQTQSCGAYLCGTDACLTSCTGDSQCISTAYCDTSTSRCKQDLANGTACSRGHQCTSGNCVDGVCCNSACGGQCEACDVTGSVGTCTAVSGAPHGSRTACTNAGTTCGGTCNGTETTSCTYPGSTAACGTGPSCTNDKATAQDTCDGAGNCTTGATMSCAPYVCGPTTCLTSCTTGTDCASGNSCSGGKCVAQQADGTICTANDQCTSGFCVDGHCCNSACSGQCDACDVTNHLGTCTAVSGVPHGSSTACASDGSSCGGTCDGTDTSCVYPSLGTVCAPASCRDGNAYDPRTCNGSGTCFPPGYVPCYAYVCNSAGTACTSSCQSNTDCASGAVCCGGDCYLGNCCTDSACDASQCRTCVNNTCVVCNNTGLSCFPGQNGVGFCCHQNNVSACGATGCCYDTNVCLKDICCPQNLACGVGDSEVCCDGGRICCNGSCVDESTDPNNCGSCGNVCPAENDCNAGSCANGTCGTAPVSDGTSCHGGQGTCQRGACVTSSTSAYYCTPGQVECNNFTCLCDTDVDGSAVCAAVGGGGCTFNADDVPTPCTSDDDCANFGFPGQACTKASTCGSGTACLAYCTGA